MGLNVTKIIEYDTFDEYKIEFKDFILLHGEALDERGLETINFLKLKTENIIKLDYDYDQNAFIVNDNAIFQSRKFENLMLDEIIKKFKSKNIIIEATTLGFSEILMVLFFINLKYKFFKIEIIYVEPKEYLLKGGTKIKKGNFHLTSIPNNFKYVQPFSLILDNLSKKSELIAFLGFENSRLGRIVNDNDNSKKYASFVPILALPGFTPGWENISLSRHVDLIKDFKGLTYTPANNPYETVKVLSNIIDNSSLENFVIAPIGTKPCSLGAMIFVINFKESKGDIGIIYDFPKKKKDRTIGVGIIHKYSIDVNR